MQDISRLLGSKTLLATALLYSGAVTALFLMPSSGLPKMKLPSGTDKAVHFLIHAVLVFFWLGYIFRRTGGKMKLHHYLGVLLASTYYGILIELIQETGTSTRSGDILDVVANSVGAGAGIIGFIAVKSIWKTIKS